MIQNVYYKMITLIDPVSSKDIARAIIRYWKLYHQIPHTIRIINETKTTDFDVIKTLRQIKEQKGRLQNGHGIVADFWRSNNLHAWQYKKHRHISR